MCSLRAKIPLKNENQKVLLLLCSTVYTSQLQMRFSSWYISGIIFLFLPVTATYVTGFGKTLRTWFFFEIWVWCMVDKPYHRANSCSSFRPIAHFTVDLQSFVCDHATPPIIKKLRSKGVAMHAYDFSVYYVYTRSQLNGPGWNCLKWPWRSRVEFWSW